MTMILTKTKLFKRLIVLFSFVCSPVVMGYSSYNYDDDDNINLREDCRVKVAGHYLNLLDNYTRSRDYVSLLDSKIKMTRENIKDFAKKKKVHGNKISSFDFDQKTIDEYKSFVKFYDHVISSFKVFKKLRSRESEDLGKKKHHLSRFRKKVNQVFKFINYERGDLGYKFKLKYRQHCTKHRFNCPLSRKYATHLFKMKFPEGKQHPCFKYANYLR